jgi:hypothetical protein
MASYASVADLRSYLPQVPDLGQQSITVTGTPSGGTYTLLYEGATTAAIAYNASATAVQTALRATPAIGDGGVNVRGRPGAYTAAFQGTLATDAGPLSLGTNSLTGGTLPSVTLASAADALLQDCLDRATGTIRNAMRSLLADPTFDYTAYGAAATKIVIGTQGEYLTLPAYQLASATLVEYQSGSNPSSYTALAATEWEAGADGRLYRAGGWSNSAGRDRTADIGAGRERVALARQGRIYRNGGGRRQRRGSAGCRAERSAAHGTGKHARPADRARGLTMRIAAVLLGLLLFILILWAMLLAWRSFAP